LIGGRLLLIAVAILFATGLTSVAFAGEWRDLAGDGVPSMYAIGCIGCTSESYSVPSRYADELHRGYVGRPFAYANPETDAVTRSYYGAPAQVSSRAHVVHRTIKSRQANGRSHRRAVEPRMKTSHHQAKRAVARAKKLARRERPLAGNVRVASTFAALPVLVTGSRSAFNAAPVIPRPVPNIVVVNGQRVDIVSPDEVNSIDLATNATGLEQAANVSASPTLLAQALSVIAGALAAVAVGLLLIGRRSVPIKGYPFFAVRHCSRAV
jgi:hypothetical protein